MKTRIHASIAATLLALALGGCSGITHQERTTIAGVSGSAMTGGSTAGTVSGAAIGGVIGHQAGK